MADRARLAGDRQLRRPWHAADQAGLADAARARLRHPRAGDDGGEHAAPDQIGKIVIKLPLPPGVAADAVAQRRGVRDVRTWCSIPGYYLTGDAGYADEDGYFYVMSRIDDIINVAGHRLSTGAMEEVLAGHPDVAECAVDRRRPTS